MRLQNFTVTPNRTSYQTQISPDNTDNPKTTHIPKNVIVVLNNLNIKGQHIITEIEISHFQQAYQTPQIEQQLNKNKIII